jgi:hypothetical protein
MSEWIEKLNRLSLKECSDLFASLSVKSVPAIRGYYRGSFVGPGWLQAAGGPALGISGLGGWWGKHFEGDGTAINLVRQGGKLETRFPMCLVTVTSVIDDKPTLALNYGDGNPFPWPYILDELRQLDPNTLLGMTYVNVNLLRKLAFPFLLEFQEQVDGL